MAWHGLHQRSGGQSGYGFDYSQLTSGSSGGGFQQQRDKDSSSSSSSLPRKGMSVETHLAQIGFMPGTGARGYGATNLGKKRVKSEEDYFDEDDEGAEGGPGTDLEYQPAPGSPTGGDKDNSDKDTDSDDEDPLDAFMAGIDETVHKQSLKPSKKDKDKKKGVRDDIENEDDEESYFRYVEEHPELADDNEEDIEYDEDGNAIIPDYRKTIDPLPECDHSEIQYEPFNKNFFVEHDEILGLTVDDVIDLRSKLNIKVSGILPTKPVSSFAHFGFDDKLTKAIRKAKYSQPTPIQAQGVPVAMNGRDIIGIAKTGSGKTAAYVWPLLVHIMDQRQLEKGDGPIGLVCAPTRELSQQIYHEVKKFGKVYGIHAVCAYGGGSMWEQCKACEEGTEIIVATPGRLIDLVKKNATNLKRVTYVVFDEADRMFDMGFEAQVRSIANHVRPDRQTLMFSATFKRRVERLARDILTDPIRIVQGELGEANEDVTQIVLMMKAGGEKWKWLLMHLVQFTTVGSVLIFVTRKANSEELANNLKLNDFKVALMHGDMSQNERNDVITSFKRKEMPILVATDVAARGLDIPSIRVVVNFDVARDIDTHTHRIGRTGRAGEKGTAYTLITHRDRDFAGCLVRNLETAGQFVPPDLMELANQNPWFKKSRFKSEQAKKLNVGGDGLGFRERPGLGTGTGVDRSANFTHYQPTGRTTGPQSDRITTMRQAFSAQFKSNFVASTDPEDRLPEEAKCEVAMPPPPPPSYMSGFVSSSSSSSSPGLGSPSDADKPPERRRKKTRWQ